MDVHPATTGDELDGSAPAPPMGPPRADDGLAQPANDAEPLQTGADRGACVDEAHTMIPSWRSGIINRGGEVGERFTVDIRWRNSPHAGTNQSGCDCRCGEYRQYIKGLYYVNGRRETLNLWGGAQLEENVYHEDGADRNPRARYGHRDEPVTMAESYTPDRATGCTYRGEDFPRVMIGGDTDMRFTFKGQVYDKCRNVFGPENVWTVAYRGPINR